MNIEHELKSALRRKPAPEGFATRVMASVEAESGRPAGPTARAGWWRAAAAAVLLTAILGGWAAHTVAERRAGEKAKQELLLALQITGEKVRYAQSHVRTIGSQQ